MDENKSGSNSNEFDFDSFFNDFGDFESFESETDKQAEKQARNAITGNEFKPSADSDGSEGVENLDFLNSGKDDIKEIISSYKESETEPGPDVDVSAGAQNTFNINISPTVKKRDRSSAEYQPSVAFIPDENINVNDIPGYEIETKTTKTEKPKKKKLKKAEIIRRTVLALSILVIIASGGYLLKSYVLDPLLSDKSYEQASSDLIDDNAIPEGTPLTEMWQKIKAQYPNIEFPPEMLIKYANLYAANQDLRGWITINGFGIDMPLAQGKDNSYYLKRDIYKKWTEYGVPFFDYRNKTYFLNRNTVVYGHNMRYSDKIFGMLEDYRTIDGFKKAPVINCNTIYEDYTWKVYAVFLTNSEEKDDNGYVFNYTFTELKDDKFMEYISEVDKRAFYKTGVDIQPGDSILTLSTCCYDFDSAKLVVVARQVRQGESTDVDTSKAVKNANPRYPQAWYDANDKTNPYANDTRWYAND